MAGATCADVTDDYRQRFGSLARLYGAARTSGSIATPFLRALSEQLASVDPAAPRSLNHGPSHQDLVDSALAMQCKEAGRRLLDAAGVTLLDDPTVLTYAGQRWLLTHGDALCLDDHRYLAFRDEVRQPAWQQTFLAQPLERRRAIAEGLRGQSEDRKRAEAGTYAEIDHPAALRWLQAADASVLIHGHTHRPGDDALDESHRRHVLSDWDAEASPPRLEVLRITDTGVVRRVAAR